MKKLNTKKLEELLTFYGNIQYCQNLRNSENFVENILNIDETIDIVLHSPEAGVEYTAATVAAEEVPYFLGIKAMPGGLATPFQRWLAWNVVKKYKEPTTTSKERSERVVKKINDRRARRAQRSHD